MLIDSSAIEIVGSTAGAGVECPLFQLETGELVTLSGNALPADGSWRLKGYWMDNSNCMQGRTFRITQASKHIED